VSIDTTVLSGRVLADGFADRIRRWSRDAGAPESAARVAQRAAYVVSMATLEGNVCTDLADIAAALNDGSDTETVRQRLLESGVTGQPGQPDARGAMPLILDQDGRLYLHRYFDYECRLARSLAERHARQAAPEIPASLSARLASLFSGNRAALGDAADWQQIAVAMALLGKVTIISGGPGTGKTTTVVSLLACLLEQDPDCRIALAAPTGKAAARMTEAVRLRANHLPAEIQARLPTESYTIHRLLGVMPGGGFRHHAGNRLAIDALVVDEASMLDLALATRLIEAVPDDARIILLGDKDQLAAVESGAVFAELSAAPSLSKTRIEQIASLCAMPGAAIQTPEPVGQSGLQDQVVWLTRNFRFASDSGIGQLATDINSGDSAGALTRLQSDASGSLQWLEDGGPVPRDESSHAILAGYTGYLEALRADGKNPGSAAAAFASFRTLCAVRDGARGVDAINRLVSKRFRSALKHPLDPGEQSEWYPGRPVMVLRNDYVLKLFNGDIGIVMPDDAGALMVFFPEGDAGFRAVAPVRLPAHETAFAMTVHKSQGSEFDQVLVLLPEDHNPVLTRELVYTAVTRARLRVTLVSGGAVLEKAIETPTRRRSGLPARFCELQIGGAVI
jgi:exodeoxyribonuclease V alpha subunit